MIISYVAAILLFSRQHPCPTNRTQGRISLPFRISDSGLISLSKMPVVHLPRQVSHIFA